MTLHKYFFDTYEPVSGCKVFMDDNGIVEAVDKGPILVETCVEGCMWSIRIHNMFHVPKMHLKFTFGEQTRFEGFEGAF